MVPYDATHQGKCLFQVPFLIKLKLSTIFLRLCNAIWPLYKMMRPVINLQRRFRAATILEGYGAEKSYLRGVARSISGSSGAYIIGKSDNLKDW